MLPITFFSVLSPFKFAVKDGAKARLVSLQKEQGDNLSPMDRLNARRTTSRRAGQFSRRSSKRPSPCSQSLDDAQKDKFVTLGRMLVPERGRFAMEMKHLRIGAGDQQGAE